MYDKDINLLLKKAEELRALFVLGQRVIPFLEEIFVFVSEIQPLLDEINSSIQENLNKMPSASQQLSKVTEATELATTEIMDILDNLSYKTDLINNELNSILNASSNALYAPIQLLETIKMAIEDGKDLKPVLPDITLLINYFKNQSNNQTQNFVNNISEVLQNINQDSNSIMMSLQVQDITTQQIAAVNNLLNTVQNKLVNILKRFNSSEISDFISSELEHSDTDNISKLHRDIAFDPDAIDSYNNKENKQNDIDAIINEHFEDENVNELASQDDIDKMFANQDDFDENNYDKTT